jgi:hypothetical protein
MFLILEIPMLIGGLYALIAGKLTPSKGLRLQGRRARIIGLFLIAPLPLTLISGLVLGIFIAANGLDSSIFQAVTIIVEVLLTLVCLAVAGILASDAKPSNPPKLKG